MTISPNPRDNSAIDIDTAVARLISWLNARDGTRIVPLYACRFAVGEVAVVIRPMADESRLHSSRFSNLLKFWSRQELEGVSAFHQDILAECEREKRESLTSMDCCAIVLA